MTPLVRICIAMATWLGTASCGASPNSETPARREARRLYFEGLDHAVRLQNARAAAAMERALTSDPAYVPPLSYLLSEGGSSVRLGELLDTVAARAGDPGVARCISRAAASYRGVRPVVMPGREPESTAARWCNVFVSAHVESADRHLSSADSVAQLATVFPEVPGPLLEMLTNSIRGGERRAIRAAVRTATQPRLHPYLRAHLSTGLARALHTVSADSAALELEQTLMRDPASALPGFRAMVAEGWFNHGARLVLNKRDDSMDRQRHIDSIVAAAMPGRLEALHHGDQRARLTALLGLGGSTLDRGQIDDGIQYLNGAMPLADSIGDVGWRAYGRMKLGRGLVKAGRAPEAEEILLSARRLGSAARLTRVQMEVEHNLLHLYESLRRDSAALHAGEAFVRYASMGFLSPVRMMSKRDVALFLRARGRVEESRGYFERMLVDIDSLRAFTNYAGEYYELTGALDRAATEYMKAANREEDPLHAVGGLVRVTLAMGDTVGARRWAAVHDESRDVAGIPEAGLLLPSVLRRTVGGEAARQAYLKARQMVWRHGQLAAWAALTADLADLENDQLRFAQAALLADSAADAATRVGATETKLRARALAAFARARLSDGSSADAAVNELAAVAQEADRIGSVILRAEAHRLTAGVIAPTGRWRNALAEYRRAVVPLDSMAGRITMDPGQATFRSAQRRAYDEALLTIVQNADAHGAGQAYAAWSTRRKGRAYSVQWPVEFDGSLAHPPRGTAIVDFVIIDSLLAAMVVTSKGATIVPLSARSSLIRADVEALRRAVDVRVGSALDVNRALYPLAVAHRLYRALLEPLDSLLSDDRTLVIVPDGILSLVPFDALVTTLPPDARNHRAAGYVMDRRVVINATTIRTESSAWRVGIGRLTMIDPGNAPDAVREVDAVARALPRGAITVLRGWEATPSRSIAAMRDADIVHITAHSRANEHDPGSSQIDLSPEGGDDGRLGASEVAALRLASPLVFLSACETANGSVLDGEGVLSMSRSFLRAGARATVATLWPVGAAAADFAQAFYAGLAESNDAAAALHSAKLAMRSRGLPPSTWAPYQLFAAPPPAAQPSRTVARLNSEVTKARVDR